MQQFLVHVLYKQKHLDWFVTFFVVYINYNESVMIFTSSYTTFKSSRRYVELRRFFNKISLASINISAQKHYTWPSLTLNPVLACRKYETDF